MKRKYSFLLFFTSMDPELLWNFHFLYWICRIQIFVELKQLGKKNFFRFILLYFVIQIWNIENAKISCKKGEKEFPWKDQQKFGWLHESQTDWELCFILLCTVILRSALFRSAILLCTFLFCSVLPHMKVWNWNTAWIQQKNIYIWMYNVRTRRC